MNFQDSHGSWRPIDNDLLESDRRGVAAENAANDIELRLPEDAGSRAVRVVSDQYWVSFKMRGLDGAPRLDGPTATYGAVSNASSVTYEAIGTGLKESILLGEAPPDPVSFVFDLTASPGLTPKLTDQGDVEFIDAEGVPKFTVPAPFMFDSATEPVYSTAVDYDLSASEEGWTVTVRPDHAWLVDAARVYPVVVDPTITDGEIVHDCWINEASPAASNCAAADNFLRVGTVNGSARRAMVEFGLDWLTDDSMTINSAALRLTLDSSRSSTARSSDYVVRRLLTNWNSSASWNNATGTSRWAVSGGDFQQSSEANQTLTGVSGGAKSFDVTSQVRHWRTGDPNFGFLVKQAPESTANLLYFHSSGSANSGLWPKLEVTFTLDPNADDVPASERLGVEVAWEATLSCMKAGGQVGSSATVTEVLGAIDGAGRILPPSSPAAPAPSEVCINGAQSLVGGRAETADAGQMTTVLDELKQELQAGTVSALPATAGAEDVEPPAPNAPADTGPDAVKSSDGLYLRTGTSYYDCTPSADSFMLYLNYYSDRSLSDWKYNSNNEVPCRFRWDDDVCSNSPDKSYSFDFTYPCKRHDFMKRNLIRAEERYGFDAWRKYNKNVADEQFLRDLKAHCSTRSFLIKPDCYLTARIYYVFAAQDGVSTLGYSTPWTFVK